MTSGSWWLWYASLRVVDLTTSKHRCRQTLYAGFRMRNLRSPDLFTSFTDSILLKSLNIVYAAIVEVGVKAGNGRHPYYLGPQETSKAIRWSTIAFIPGVLSFTVPKISVAILLARLLNPTKRQKIFMYSLSIVVNIGGCIAVALLWQQCKPSSGLWDPTVAATCWSPDVLIDYTIAHGGRDPCV